MIEHVDIALSTWLAEALDVDAVQLGLSERGGSTSIDDGMSTKRGKPSGTTVSLRLVGVSEQLDRRSNAVSDLRDDDGRVVGRRGAARVFDLDYLCEVDGEPIEAHRVLGQLLQLLIGHETVPVDVVPADIVPTELTMRDVPIEIDLAPPNATIPSAGRAGSDVGVVIRATLPIWPSVDTQIGEPAVHLHLDVGPEPGESGRSANGGRGDAIAPIDRQWTTVRRREFIAPGSTAAEAR